MLWSVSGFQIDTNGVGHCGSENSQEAKMRRYDYLTFRGLPSPLFTQRVRISCLHQACPARIGIGLRDQIQLRSYYYDYLRV